MNRESFETRLDAYIRKHTGGNYMISPLSFRFALGLLLSGTAGNTKAEILSVLGADSMEESERVCRSFSDFALNFQDDLLKEAEEFRKYAEEGWIEEDAPAPSRALRVANAIWERDDLGNAFKDSFKRAVSEKYDAECGSFSVSDAAEKINAWADQKTEGMIERILPEDFDAENIESILTNALYFKDSWMDAFDEEDSFTGKFTTEAGSFVQKDYMTQTSDFAYYEDKETRLVSLPMNGSIGMAFVLGNTDDFPRKLAEAYYCPVQVTIPKLEVETALSAGELTGFLKESGVRSVFDPESADFSLMTERRMVIDDIIQKTKLKLDEEGVEAASVTAMCAMAGCLPDRREPVIFTADRPFSFFIYADTDIGPVIMFCGRISE